MNRRLGIYLACSTLLSCSGGRGKPTSHPGSLLASTSLSASYVSPASFRYHPPKQALVQAEHRLADGRILTAGQRGERWLLDTKAHRLSSATNLAPEDLIAVLEGDDNYWFIGQSGTNYEAHEPLANFLRSSAPLEPLVRVSAARRSIIGIPADRSLTRSADGGASFQRVGPEHVAFADVELAGDGTGLALAIPEALWVTRDEGASWALLPDKSHGVFALSRDREGHVRVDTVFGPFRFTDSPPRIEPGVDALTAQDLETTPPPRGPDAAALADGRAVVVDGRYFEVSAPAAHPSDYELVQGPLDGKLRTSAVPELKDCRGARIAGFESVLELACFRGPGDTGSVPVAFFRSDTSARHFELEPFGSFATPASFRFASGAGGSLLVTGLCGLPSPGCSTGGVFFRREAPSEAPSSKLKVAAARPAQARYELVSAAAPTLAETALGVTFSLDGRTGYAVGRRSKTGALAIFVSHDGGKSFEPRDLDLVRADSEDEDLYWEHSRAALKLESFAAGEEGSLSLVIADQRGRTLIVADEQGRLLSGSKAPEEQALMASVGTRAFALSPSTRKAWESMDGGVSWQALARFPFSLCSVESECDVKLRCVPGGCVIGNEVSRIGWAGQSESDNGSYPPPSRDPSPLAERKLRSSLSCSLDDTSWQSLLGVSELPNSHDAAFGKVSFVAVSIDTAHAAASVIHGVGAPRPHVEIVRLLQPVERPNQYAFEVLDQVEGAAALRYKLPDDPAKDNHLRNVEVAWDNALAGQVGRARLPDGGLAAPADYGRGDPAWHADPDLLSIGEGGLYLRLHHAAGDEQDTWYFDGHASTLIPPVKWPLAPNLRGRTEMARSENSHLALMLFGHGTAVARARRVGAGFEFDARTAALPDPSAFGQTVTSNLAYSGRASGLYVQTESNTGGATAVYFPFRPSGEVLGPAVPVPTQQNLADRPERCRPAELASTPRIDASYVPGVRHPIVVSDASDPPRLFLSTSAVMYGTPDAACATALDADEVAVDAAALRHERVLVLLDDLEHSWLFRKTTDANGATSVQYRTMKCHFDPGAEVPSEVYKAPGTLVERR